MEYTSNSLLLLLAFLLFASAGADNSPDSLCKSLVETKGYVCEEHKVTTKDGYILGVQRIPVGRTNKTTANRPPILLQHGLLVDAATWLLNSPNKSLAFILADNGFDVWLGNNRGTISSRGHTSLSANDPGTLLAFTAFSQEKLVNMTKSAALLGPIAYLGQLSSVFGRTIVTTAEQAYWLGVPEFIPEGLVVGKLLEGVCVLPLIDCNNVLTALGGPNCCIKPSTIDVLFDHTFQSTSTKNFVHLSQMIRAGNIAKYGYGDESENKAHYGQPTPPLYYMTRIPKDIPLFISYGRKDTLSDVNDVQLLLENLKDHEKDKLVVQYIDYYAHFDFIMAENANRVVYDILLAFFMTP
nr:triacylglycerol lipase 2 [Quercus suber]